MDQIFYNTNGNSYAILAYDHTKEIALLSSLQEVKYVTCELDIRVHDVRRGEWTHGHYFHPVQPLSMNRLDALQEAVTDFLKRVKS